MEFQGFEPENKEKEEPQNAPLPDKQHFRSLSAGKTEKFYRVGVTTMGFSLVALGGLLLTNVLIPNFSLEQALLYVAPAVLVLLGIEITLGALFNRSGKLRYDFMSMLICFLLVVGGIGASIIPRVMRTSAVVNQLTERVTRDVEKDVYEALKDENIDSVFVNYFLPDKKYPIIANLSPDIPYREITEGRLSLNIDMDGEYKNKLDFAKDVSSILKKLTPLDLPSCNISFGAYGPEGKERYYLHVDSLWMWDDTPEQLVEKIN